MTEVDHEHVTYWWKRAKEAERLLRRLVHATKGAEGRTRTAHLEARYHLDELP